MLHIYDVSTMAFVPIWWFAKSYAGVGFRNNRFWNYYDSLAGFEKEQSEKRF